jgi:hypothetical protein
MPEPSDKSPRIFLWRRVAIAVNLLALLVLVALAVQFGTAAENAARVRNSLIAEIGQAGEFDWSPVDLPSGYRSEESTIPGLFNDIVLRLLAEVDGRDMSDHDKARLLASHMVRNRNAQRPIQSDSINAYRRIIEEGDGYCADYSQVFTGLALAAKLPVREWGLAWNGFGFGHTFNEVFERELDKWVFIDSFYSMYAVDADTGVPLSVLEFQERLRSGAAQSEVRVVPILSDKFPFKTQKRALEYYSRGADQFYLFWGNNVFSYDHNFFVRLLGALPRHFEVAVAIILDIHPAIRLVETDTNAAHIEALWNTKRLTLGFVWLLVVIAGSLVLQVWLYKRASRCVTPPTDRPRSIGVGRNFGEHSIAWTLG